MSVWALNPAVLRSASLEKQTWGCWSAWEDMLAIFHLMKFFSLILQFSLPPRKQQVDPFARKETCLLLGAGPWRCVFSFNLSRGMVMDHAVA